MSRVNVDSIKPWIAKRVTELLGIEDDVVVEFVYNQLEESRVMHIFFYLGIKIAHIVFVFVYYFIHP